LKLDPLDNDPLDLAHLDQRTGWPADLRLLLDRHPRPTWPGHPNLGALSRFWLERHAMFRELGRALGQGAVELREGRLEPAAFQPWFAPRMQLFLQQLHHHHLIEDHNYFPAFRVAEPRLARGFEVLEADHGTIDQAIHDLARASNGLLAALQAPTADVPGATAGLATSLPAFLHRLGRHLGDEEDLLIPLILERSEAGLGVA
jgi:hemerythrin-like domain-containing protein